MRDEAARGDDPFLLLRRVGLVVDRQRQRAAVPPEARARVAGVGDDDVRAVDDGGDGGRAGGRGASGGRARRGEEEGGAHRGAELGHRRRAAVGTAAVVVGGVAGVGEVAEEVAVDGGARKRRRLGAGVAIVHRIEGGGRPRRRPVRRRRQALERDVSVFHRGAAALALGDPDAEAAEAELRALGARAEGERVADAQREGATRCLLRREAHRRPVRRPKVAHAPVAVVGARELGVRA